MDSVNDRETILASFQPYYEVTTVKEETDVNHLYDLKGKINEFQVVDKILTNKAFGDWVKDFYMKRTYSRLNQ